MSGELADSLASSSYFDGDKAQRKLQEAILTLPEKQRIIFNMKYFDDMKDSLNKSIVVAQDAADNLREQAKSEADTLRINSEKESADIIANAGQKSSSY